MCGPMADSWLICMWVERKEHFLNQISISEGLLFWVNCSPPPPHSQFTLDSYSDVVLIQKYQATWASDIDSAQALQYSTWLLSASHACVITGVGIKYYTQY